MTASEAVNLLGLSEKDVVELQHPAKWLSDHHINAAAVLLFNIYPHVQGLKDVIVDQVGGNRKVGHGAIQMHNMAGNHWVLSTTLTTDGSIHVYDSMSGVLSATLLRELRRTYDGQRPIRLIECQRQQGANDCGLFAIATARALCHARTSPIPMTVFDQAKMRAHLLRCFRALHLSPFPLIPSSTAHPGPEEDESAR